MIFKYLENDKIWDVVTINFYNQTITLRHEDVLLVEAFDIEKLMIEEK